MKRDYTTGIQSGISMFIGEEVENTPAKGMRTLFVVGVQDPLELGLVLQKENDLVSESEKIKHIYFGANQSFKTNGINDFENWNKWEEMIKPFLKLNLWCTLDLDVSEVEGLLESGLCEYDQFIPQISVKIPYLQQLNYNATIKIDDKDFKATNPGVWCMPLNEMLKRDYYTNWTLYGKDKVIK